MSINSERDLEADVPQHGWADGESLREVAIRRARGLALFSLGLGFLEVSTPGFVAKLVGIRNDGRSRDVLRAVGVRELVSGLGLLSRPSSATWVWARVAGDALDLVLLGSAVRVGATQPARAMAAGAAVLGVAALDISSAAMLSRNETVQRLTLPIHVVKSITINRTPEVVYHFWRDLKNLPRFMAHLESVEVTNGTSTWRAKAPAGMTVEWQAEIIQDRPNDVIAWRSLEGASVPNRGAVRFVRAPGGRGTQVHVELKYDPPGGMLAATIAKLFGEEPGQQIAGDLRRLKQVLETGSVVHSDASVHRGLHPARPSEQVPRLLEKVRVDP
jgi:uncharacterized membrane protein